MSCDVSNASKLEKHGSLSVEKKGKTFVNILVGREHSSSLKISITLSFVADSIIKRITNANQ